MLIKRLKRYVAATLIASIGLVSLSPAYASTASNMDSYWSGSMSNVTGPSAYKSQSANQYSGGSLVFRSPQQSTQLMSVQLPSINAGCGGIDIFAGSFSFINSAQLVALAKGIASNAVGFAFDSALKFLSPDLYGTLKALEKAAQDVNSMNLNSCHIAENLVNGVGGTLNEFINNNATMQSAAAGVSADAAAGAAAAQVDPLGTLNKALGSVSTTGGTSNTNSPASANLAWEAMQQNDLLGADNDLAELAMSLTGTIINTCSGTGASASCTHVYKPPYGDQNSLLNELLDGGGSVDAYDCSSDTENCLTPTLGHVSIPVASAFRTRVYKDLEDIVAKIQSRTALTTEDQGLIESTPLPVMKMARIYATAYDINGAKQMMDRYADLIGMDILLAFIRDQIQAVREGAGTLVNIDGDSLKNWVEGTNQLVAILEYKESIVAEREAAVENVVAGTRAVAGTLSGQYSTLFGQAAAMGPG